MARGTPLTIHPRQAKLLERLADLIDLAQGVPLIDEPEPVRFARRCLGVRPWKGQREFLRAVARGAPRVSWATGHGVGKTHAAALLVMWWLATGGPGTLVITSAPTNRQVELLLWREINALWGRSPDLVRLGSPLRKQIELGPNWAAYGFSTDEPDRFQGLHAPRLRILIDEANGFPEHLFIALDSCLTGGDVQLVLVGNALEPYGRFYASFGDGKTVALRTSARTHPNVRSGRELISGAVTRSWIVEFEERYGIGSAISRARIDGEFPEGSGEGLVTRAQVQAARTVMAQTFQPVIMGVDVARWGSNRTVVTLARGQNVLEQRAWQKQSTIVTADRIAALYDEFRCQVVVVDDDGIGGAVTDILRDRAVPVVAFRGGMKADEPDRFANRISEAYWRTRELLAGGALCIAATMDLERQLVMRNYRLARDKLLLVEPKDEFTKRTGLASPDEADSLAMTCHELVTRWQAMAS